MSKGSWPKPELQLDSTFILWKRGEKGYPTPLTSEERNKAISALIKDYGGVQEPSMGTLVFDLPLEIEGVGELACQVWIHDWE